MDVNNSEWLEFRLFQEREAVLASLKDALADISIDLAEQLRVEFMSALDRGGVESLYSLSEVIDWIRLPVLYPVVTESFVRARLPTKELSARARDQRARRLLKAAKRMESARDSLFSIPGGSSWCAVLGKMLDGYASKLVQMAEGDKADRDAGGPGRLRTTTSEFAVELDLLFGESNLLMTKRCELIAAVVSAFVEPVSGERVRQRIKDLRRRPPQRRRRRPQTS